uniref:Uncharacterized protein n=1 Tax=Meloidogyne javanica TaxID=6303 RepID=A0A915MAA8_MELJA
MNSTGYVLLKIFLMILVKQGFINGLPSFQHDTFEISCSRLYGETTKPSFSDIFYRINFYKLYNMLNLDGKSSRETIWILLAKLLVPLPRWDRGEILMKFCRVVLYETVKMKADDSMKQVYDLLLKRINALSGRRLLDDEYYSYLNTVCDLTKQSTLNEENFDKLIRYIENLLILFEFKSAYAVEFGQKLRETDTKTQKCLKNLKNLKLENEERSYKRPISTLQTNDREEIIANQDTRLKIMLTKQVYFKKLREIMEIAMLMEGERDYAYRLQKELQAVHKKGSLTGVIKFLFLHIDKDMGKIMELYKKDELEKDLKMFENRFYGANNFFMAYKQILSQIQDESNNCYNVTEKELKFLNELETLKLKDDAVLDKLIQKYSSPFIDIISFGDIGMLNEAIINDEFMKLKDAEASSSIRITSEEIKSNFEIGQNSSSEHEPILEESTHSHQEGEISKEAEIDVIEPEIHVDNGISNNDVPNSEAEILDNKSVNDDNFSAPASEREK